MNPELFGKEHILYIIISTVIGILTMLFSYKFAKEEKTKMIILKIIATLLFISIMEIDYHKCLDMIM